MFTVDAHLDLSMNAMEWNRDLRQSVKEIRKLEKGMNDKPDRAKGTVAFPEMRKGNIGLCVATQIARYVKLPNPLPGWNSPEQAWAQTQAQLAWYRTMEEAGELKQIVNYTGLTEHLELWESGANEIKPIGYILSLEGADSIVNLSYLERAYEQGLRALGPAHYGPGIYAQGTDAQGGIGKKGIELLKAMQELHMILDVTHLCDESFWEALDVFEGAVWASHSNCRALVPNHRQFDDQQIKVLIERGAVIGAALDAWMLVPNWTRGTSSPETDGVDLNKMIDNFDHICQIAGNSLHIGIGTDLDGGFGKEQCPHDLETIADLQLLPDMLSHRGYSPQDIENVMFGNWLRFLKKSLGRVKN
ncbi:MAG: membrane dipeptidase [Bacteroidetes bacterium]|nr:membrane dipeptidase [Bacteroidota bacterium]